MIGCTKTFGKGGFELFRTSKRFGRVVLDYSGPQNASDEWSWIKVDTKIFSMVGLTPHNGPGLCNISLS